MPSGLRISKGARAMSESSMPAEQRVLFMYYKVPLAERATALAATQELMTRLAASIPEVRCELMQRPEVSKGVETWMEVYRAGSGVTEALEKNIEALIMSIPALDTWPRAREVFVPLRMQ